MRRLLFAAVSAVTAVAGLLGGCAPLDLLNRALVPTDGYTLAGDIRYGREPRHRLDVYMPAAAAVPAPVVVFFYGGSWRSGERAYYRFVGEALTSQGFVVVVPDYRLYPDVRFPAFVEDGALAVRWVQQHIAAYGGAPDRIFLIGHSAGAHIAAMLAADRRFLDAAGVRDDAIRGIVGLAGPYAFDPFRYRTTRDVFAGLDDVAKMQPGTYADGDEAPMLLLHGGRDGTVYPVNSHALAERVRAAGGDAEVIELPDLGHIGVLLALARPFRRQGGVADQVAAFIHRN